MRKVADWLIGWLKGWFTKRDVIKEYHEALQKLKMQGYKICSMCGKIKPLSEFHKAGKGYRSNCKECAAKQQKECRAKMTYVYIKEKKCSKCEQVKPVDGFYKDSSKKDGYSSACKECIKAYIYEKRGTPTSLF